MYTDGIFDVIGKAATGFSKAADAVLTGKMQYDAVKSAWKGVPYAYPAASYGTPGMTGERIEPDRALNAQEIRELQTRLNSLGYDAGPVDGLFGPKTAAGISAFQRATGSTQTGKASLRILESARAAMTSRPISSPPVYSFPPIYTPPAASSSPAPRAVAAMPAWLIPVALGGVGLMLLMNKRR